MSSHLAFTSLLEFQLEKSPVRSSNLLLCPLKFWHHDHGWKWRCVFMVAPKFRDGTLYPWISEIGSLHRQKNSGTSVKKVYP